MKQFIIIFFCIAFLGCSKCQTSGYLGRLTTAPKALIIIAGESNAGGFALNADLSTYEAAPRVSTQILNNTSLLFETLDIGTNNLIGHNGLADNATHGFENGIANSADSGIVGIPVYLMKSGQGGSRIIQWTNADSTYGAGGGIHPYEIFKSRVDTAIKLMTSLNKGTTPPLYLLWTQGINDTLANYYSSTTWKDSTKSLFTQIRARYGNMPIFITHLPAFCTSYNDRITEIASEVSDCYAITTSDAGMRDANHWNYAGMKLIGARFFYLLRTHL